MGSPGITAIRSGEQRRAAESAGLLDRSNRDVLVVPGPDRLDWLHAICSQHVSLLREGDSTQALVLSPNGHVEQHWVLTEFDGQIWLDTEPGAADEVLNYLLKMRFLKRVEPAVVTADWAVLAVTGPSAAAVLAEAGLPVPERQAAALASGGFVRAFDGRYELVLPRANWLTWPSDCAMPAPRRPEPGPPLRCGPSDENRGWAWTPITGRCRTRRAGSTSRCTWTRVVIAARRRWPGCRTWVSRRGGWCCCTCPETRK